MSRDIENQMNRRRRFPLEVLVVLLLFGAWVWSGAFHSSMNQRSIGSLSDRPLIRESNPSRNSILRRRGAQNTDRSGRSLALQKAKRGAALNDRAEDLNLTTILQKTPRDNRGDVDKRLAEAAKALAMAGDINEGRTVSLGKGIKVRIDGKRLFADVRLPLSKIVGVGFGDRMVNVSGEVFVKSSGRKTQIYLEPSQIDGKEPPGIVRRMLRGVDLYELFAKDYPIEALLSRLSKRF